MMSMMSVKNIYKILESLDGRNTKITLLTHYRDHFSRYLTKRKIILDPPFKIEVWNNIESAYTAFELPVPSEVADLISDDWLDEYARSVEAG